MTGYWIRCRSLVSLLLGVVIALIAVLLFVFPFISQQANNYNSQSVYKNTSIDFIAPEPSFDQINELSGNYGIDKVFPFFLTKTSVNVGGNSRTTTVLLSDQFQNVDITMYNSNRLIKQSDTEYDNPILVDWKFCKDTLSDIGDMVSFTIGDTTAKYTIYAIYETNSIYEGGAILVQLSAEQKDSIVQNAQNNGYSGMYISVSDYNACQSYLTTDYRPLGRLKAGEQFYSEEQYQVHYDAIMSSGYANEITDFRVRENSLDKNVSPLMVWIGATLSAIIVIAFNVVMSKRGSEKGYFTKHCIPKGQNVKPYYTKTFICELIFFAAAYVVAMLYKINFSADYIPKMAIGTEVVIIPIAVLVAEMLSLMMNRSMVKGIIRKEKKH
ncbi:MAG: hypothetical protein K2K06_08710 [Oscillospiraceae bacterium]|nr:hypothetical protein [Oscillospiraceae bacterium]